MIIQWSKLCLWVFFVSFLQAIILFRKLQVLYQIFVGLVHKFLPKAGKKPDKKLQAQSFKQLISTNSNYENIIIDIIDNINYVFHSQPNVS